MPSDALSVAFLAAGGGGLADINFGLTLWTVVLFALFAWILTKFGWKPLLHMIEEREKSIREAVEGAEKASAEAQALLEKHKELLREGGRERDEMMKRALKEAEQLKADLAAKAKAEGEQMIQRARDQIGRETGLAMQQLRAQVADLAVEAAAKIVTSSLTPEAQRKLVAEFIETLPKTR